MRLFAAALLAVLLVAGCGAPEDVPENTRPPLPTDTKPLPAADDPVAWVDRLCAALAPVASLQGRIPEFNRNDPAASRDALSRYFADTTAQVGDSLQGLDQAGPSPIPGGAQAAGALRGALENMRASYQNARDQVDRVDPSDPVGLGTQLPGILAKLSQASPADGLRALNENQQLRDAVRQATSCGAVATAAKGN